MKKKWRGLFADVAADLKYTPKQANEFTVREFVEAVEAEMTIDTARNRMNKLVAAGQYARRVCVVKGLACMVYRKVKK